GGSVDVTMRSFGAKVYDYIDQRPTVCLVERLWLAIHLNGRRSETRLQRRGRTSAAVVSQIRPPRRRSFGRPSAERYRRDRDHLPALRLSHDASGGAVATPV